MTTPRVAILGAGFSGLCMGIRLREAGIASFAIYEKADRVGGTWRDNVYPGICCDVPSHLYSFSFAPNPDWSRLYAPGEEIQAYCERVARDFGLAPHLRFGAEVVRVDWTGDEWRIAFADGSEERADFVVSGLGALHRPSTPAIPGLERFRGASFHSARWDTAHDVAGERVAVVGSAASAIQIVPEIAGRASHVTVFQRTPNWILPRRDRAYPAWCKRLFRLVPLAQRLHRLWIYLNMEWRVFAFEQEGFLSAPLERMCRAHIAKQVADPELRATSTPDYRPGCKRILVSDDWFDAVQRDDVAIETSAIERVEERGIVTADGALHEVDTIVWATGFEPFSLLAPLVVTGRDGRRLDETWAEGIEAHRTVAVAGYPNFFMLLGPNSGLGHNSIILIIEAQARYVLQLIRAAMRPDGSIARIEPRPDATAAFNRDIQERLATTIWKSGCRSWYMDERGRVYTLWPGSTLRYLWTMRRPRLAEYERRAAQGAVA
ncbi:MAG: NAD(P)/FAD-dependent oxidoreductase [Myxococcota bacterium]